MGSRVGMRSGHVGLTGCEGSMICLIRLLARIKDVTSLSQAKKSTLEVRSGICVTVGKVLEVLEVTKVVMQ